LLITFSAKRPFMKLVLMRQSEIKLNKFNR
jgi:hypothetical protein